MSLASRAVKRLSDLYRGVVVRSRGLNAGLFHPQPRASAEARACLAEALEPRLLLSGGIAGTVYDHATTAPLSGVWVDIFQGSDPQRADNQAWDYVGWAYTDDFGGYTVEGLEARCYRVRVDDGADSGGTHYINANLYDVAVVDGATTSGMDLSLRQAGILSGYVYDDLTGLPIDNARVIVEAEYQADGDDGWREALTDATGRYDLYLAPTDTAIYPVKVIEAPSGTFLPGGQEGSYATQIAPGLYAASLGGTTGPDFHLSLGGVIHGTVVTEFGDPVQYIDVMEPLAHIDNGIFEDSNARCDSSGKFWLKGVPADTDIYLQTTGWGWQWFEDSLGRRFAWGERLLGAFQVGANGLLDIGTFTVHQAGTIQGAVTDATGNPIADAFVEFTGIDAEGGEIDLEDSSGAYTDSLGRYECDYLPAGQVTVRVSKDGWLAYRAEAPVALAPGGAVSHDVVLQAASDGAHVSGRITNYDEVAPRNAAGDLLPYNLMDYEDYDGVHWLGVAAFPAGAAWSAADLLDPGGKTAADEDVEDGYGDYFVRIPGTEGTYQFDLPPGQYDVVSVRDIATGTAGWQVMLGDPVALDVSAGQTVGNFDLSMPAGNATVRGNLILPAGYGGITNQDSLMVILRPVGQSDWLLGRTLGNPDPAGQYVLNEVPAGTYTLVAIGRDLARWESAPFEVGGSGPPIVMDVVMGYGALAVGVVTSGGVPLAGAIVRSQVTDFATVTDDSGAYTLTGLADGEDTLTASKPGYQDQSAVVTLTGGETTPADFDLAAIDTSRVEEVALRAGTGYGVAGMNDTRQLVGLEIKGVGITGIELVMPWGETVRLADNLPAGWNGSDYVEYRRGALHFCAEGDGGSSQGFYFDWDYLDDGRYATLRGGQVAVTITYGGGLTWSHSLDFDGLTDVTREPGFTNVFNRQALAPDATIEWAPWADAPTGAAIRVDLERWDDGWGGYGDEEYLPPDATSWALPNVPEDAMYRLELFFLDTGTDTVDGVPVTTVLVAQSDLYFYAGWPVDDFGNAYAEAALVGAPASFSGSLDYIGDIDFFLFHAVAGQTYDILADTIAPGDADDTTLWLYDTDGRTLLTWDDEGGLGGAGRIVWQAPVSGTYYLAVDAWELSYDPGMLGSYDVQISESALAGDAPAATVACDAWFLLPLTGDLVLGWSDELNIGAPTGDDDETYGVLHFLSFADPPAPVELGAISIPIEGVSVSPDGRYLYVGDDSNAWSAQAGGHAEIVVLDIQDPSNVREVARVPAQQEDIDGLAIAGAYLLVGTQPDDELFADLEAYSLADPAHPVFVGHTGLVANPSLEDFDPNGIVVSGDRAYVLHDEDAVSVFDLSDPASPSWLGTWTAPSPGTEGIREWAVVDGSRLWFGAGWEVRGVDLADPANPVELGRLAMDGEVWQIVLDGGLLYVGCNGVGLRVVDISDPDNPQLVRTGTVLGASGSAMLHSGYVYVPTVSGQTAVFSQHETDGFEPDDTPGAASDVLTDGTPQAHSFHSGADVDWMKFTLDARSDVTIVTDGTPGGDAMVWLYGPDSFTTLVAAADDHAGGGYPSIVRAGATALGPGEYCIRVAPYAQLAAIDSYTVAVTAAPATPDGDAYEPDNAPADARWIAVNGAAQQHGIHVPGDTDWLRFELLAASAVTIETAGPGGDTEMWLYASGDLANAIDYDDDGGAGGLSRIERSGGDALDAGVYYVRVAEKGADETIPDYAVAVTATVLPDAYPADDTPAEATPIAPDGTPQSHSLDTGADVDWTYFDLTERSDVTIRTAGAQGDTVVYLYGPDDPSLPVAEDDDSGDGYFSLIELRGERALGPGRYHVKVVAYGSAGAVPAYELSVEAIPGGDTTPPAPVSFTPLADGTVRITFSEPVLARNIDEGCDLLVTDGAGRRVWGSLQWIGDDEGLIWTPDRRPAAADTWTIALAGADSSDFVDRSWNPAGQSYTQSWYVAPIDLTPPRVTDFAGFADGSAVVTFSEPMAAAALIDNPLLVAVTNEAGVPVDGSVSWSDGDRRLQWRPTAAPAQPAAWTIRLAASKPAQLADTAGNLLDGDGDALAGGDYAATWAVGAAAPAVAVCKGQAGGRAVIDFTEQMNAANVQNSWDIRVVDADGREVPGRLTWGRGNQRLTWEPKVSPIGTETWALTLAGSAGGFVNGLGTPLDGDGDGAPGGDFTFAWQVTSRQDLPLKVLAFESAGDGTVILDFSRPVLADGVEAGWDLRVVDAGGRVVPGSIRWEYGNTRLTWTPDVPAAGSEQWTITLVGRDAGDFVDTQFGLLQGGEGDESGEGGDYVRSFLIGPPGASAATAIRPDAFEDDGGNDTRPQATVLDVAGGATRFVGLSLHDDADVDWYVFGTAGEGAAKDAVFADFQAGAGAADLLLCLYDGQTLLRTSTSQDLLTGGRRSRISLDGLPAGTYWLEVSRPGTADSAGGRLREYSLTVQPPVGAGVETWTVLYYVAGDNDLDGAYYAELDRMERLDLPGNVTAAVQYDRAPGADSYGGVKFDDDWSQTRRGLLARDMTDNRLGGWLAPVSRGSSELDMGAPGTLADFIAWAAAAAPADHYVLNVVNHGDACKGACWDVTNGQSYLDFGEIGSALADAGVHLDILVMNTCMSAMAELAAATAGSADYLVASEELSFSGSMPLQLALFEHDTGRGARRLAGEIAEVTAAFNPPQVEHLGRTLQLTQSVVELSRMAELNARVAAFVAAAAAHVTTDADWALIAAAVEKAPAFYRPYSRDLGRFMQAAASTAGLAPEVRDAADAVRQALQRAVAWSFSGADVDGLAVSLPELLSWNYPRMAAAFDGATGWGGFLQALKEAMLRRGAAELPAADFAEPNDRPQDAYQLRPVQGLAVLDELSIDDADDVDFFMLELAGDADADSLVRATATDVAGGLELLLYDLTGEPVTTAAAAAGQVSLDGLAAGRYYLEVAPAAGAQPSPYELLIVTPHRPDGEDWAGDNHDRDSALGLDVKPGQLVPNVGLVVDADGADWFYLDLSGLTNGRGGCVRAVSSAGGELELELFAPDAAGPLAGASGDRPRVDIPAGSEGRFHVRVATGDGPKAYTLEVRAPSYDPCPLVIGQGGAKALTYRDGDRTLVTVSLKGDGTARLFLDGPQADDLLASPGRGGTIDLSAFSLELAEIVLSGTTARTTLSFKTSGGATAGAVIGGISSDPFNAAPESLKAIAGKTMSLADDLTLTGLLGSLQLGDVMPGSEIDIAGEVALADVGKSSVKVTLGRVADASLETHDLPIKSLTVTEWLAAAGGKDDVVDTVAASRVDLVATKGAKENLRSGVAGSPGDFEANITCDVLGKVKIKGSLRNVELLVAQPVDSDPRKAKLLSLGALTVGGVMDGVRIQSMGNVGAISAAATRNCSIFAGNWLFEDALGAGGVADGVLDLPAAATVVGSGVRASIKSVTVTGKQRFDGLYAMVNTNIAADAVGTARLCFARTDNDGGSAQCLVPFGVSTGAIGTFQYTDAGQSTSLTKIERLDVPLRDGDMELCVD